MDEFQYLEQVEVTQINNEESAYDINQAFHQDEGDFQSFVQVEATQVQTKVCGANTSKTFEEDEFVFQSLVDVEEDLLDVNFSYEVRIVQFFGYIFIIENARKR